MSATYPLHPGETGTSAWQRMVNFCRENPLIVTGAAIGIAAAGVIAYKALYPEEAFIESPAGVKSLRQDSRMAADLERVSEALIELGATGVLTAEEGAAITSEFLELVRARSKPSEDGEPRLDRSACTAVFKAIGIHDEAVADRIFETWDVDGTGSIDMKEFLHALVLVLRGSHSEKIDMCFTIMDMDGDGQISKNEMLRFLQTVDALNGEKHTLYSLHKEIDGMFAAVKTHRFGYFNRQEFHQLASQTKFHLGAKLDAFMLNLQKKFSSSMAKAARGAKVPMLRTPSTDNSGEFSDYNALRAQVKAVVPGHEQQLSPVLKATSPI